MDDLSRILILYTGGTIGMKRSARGFAPSPGFLGGLLAGMRSFHEPGEPLYTTPVSRAGKRVRYDIIEYEPLLDSSNMGMEDWARIARDIGDHYEMYDAFVVLHGTDTMAYSAAALSFMLENLAKPVIVTGSQIPLSQLRNDGQDNLLGALMVAGHYVIPEVGLFFAGRLLRGNRASKVDASGLDAFASGNQPPLASAGIDIDVDWTRVRIPPDRPLHVQTGMNPNVGVLRVFPGIPADLIRNALRPPLQGLVLQTYGAGNAPDTRGDFLDALREATDRGVVIVNVTQCQRGMVKAEYAAGAALFDAGVIGGRDMTPEAALAKLSYLLARGLSVDDVKRLMQRNLRGELTPEKEHGTRFSFREKTFARAVVETLKERMSTGSADLGSVQEALFPVLACTAAATGDISQLARLVATGVDLNVGDYDGRRPLHLAACEGHLEAVQFLLDHGAEPGVRDRWGQTPHADAVRHGCNEVAELLAARGTPSADVTP